MHNKQKIKLLHLAQSAGYGVTVYVESLIRNLDKGSFQQQLLGSEYYDNERFREIVEQLIIVHMERNISKNDLRTILQCREVVKRQSPDIVYCHSAKAGIYGRIACFGRKTKVVYNPHGWAFNMKCSAPKRAFYSLVEALFSTITDKIIAISDFEKASTPWYISKSKVQVIKNGIDIEGSKTLLSNNTLTREKLGIPAEAFVIGMTSRISIQKGQDMLVDIAKKVKERVDNAFFVIVGDKSDDVDIENLIERNGLSDNFLITGEVQNAINYASLFDVAVLTSRWEGFGLVLPEYMLSGIPIVAYAVDAVPEIIVDEYNGLLVPPNDINRFAEALIRLYDDSDLRKRLVENAFNEVSKYDIKRVAQEHEKLFVELNQIP